MAIAAAVGDTQVRNYTQLRSSRSLSVNPKIRKCQRASLILPAVLYERAILSI
jgi:hypothetical protein